MLLQITPNGAALSRLGSRDDAPRTVAIEDTVDIVAIEDIVAIVERPRRTLGRSWQVQPNQRPVGAVYVSERTQKGHATVLGDAPFLWVAGRD